MDISNEVFQKRKTISTYWHNKAADLHASAGVLWKAIEGPTEQQTGFSHAVACWSVYQMLCGMSLELLFKATIVAKGLEPKPSHNLDVLSKEAGVVFHPDDIPILEILSEAIIWDGRYPVPKKESYYHKLNELHGDHLYDRIPNSRLDIRSYNKKLDWEPFNRLWQIGSDAYWAHC